MEEKPRGSRPRGRVKWVVPLIVVGLMALGSCTNMGYYAQSLSGGAKVLRKRRPVEKVLADSETSDELRAKLELAVEMREFASQGLALPDNDSYRKYADLARRYAVWNVVAAPELSVAPKTWCFAIAGCVAYRGYFSEAKAEKFAAKMRRQGYDVDVGGVAAYSTIGWFADPLLNTFINRQEEHLAGLIFHELAHQQLFVKGDTMFNESFAMTIEEEGALRWLESRGLEDRIASYRLLKRRERQFAELVAEFRGRLAEVYSAEESDEWKRRRKEETLLELRLAYEGLKEDWEEYSGFDGWFDRDLNNARLALIGVYHQLVPAFQELLERHEGQLEPFYREVAEIAALDAVERHARLTGASAADSEVAPE